ncbi:permease [Thioalkalivibrio nitratireducens DSM 14787]|uniref:Permease n=1 Tax=Thioalkalivibrio nitratireducens (strain DSM 14787 / UNIQEM 213 / ALEN2) TaxID=1255043 RepID=L0DYP0_THIND|nr:SO_0444 family Cu/Zn efflux transporter [Thioalkalivibrio nitratireducens]AGA34080.1 permease [Thioalkalivibrio nitratireducens DSM 14787]
MNVLHEILGVALAAAPWLLLGLFVSGLIRAFVDDAVLQRWVGGEEPGSIGRAAVIGAPLPLCSCGAIPTALTLHRAGAGRGPTTAFLIGTPGIGVDSLAITYALLGPFMMLVRALGAVVTAVVTGLLVAMGTRGTPMPVSSSDGRCACNAGGCGSEPAEPGPPGSVPAAPAQPPPARRLHEGMRYAFGDLLEDIGPWLLGGLVVAGVLIALVPAQVLSTYGSGPVAMLVMAVIGIPMYICAAAATPIAAGMLVAGVSPGTVLVFLLAGPITSAATLGLLRREFTNVGLAWYLGGIVASTIAVGMATDGVIGLAGLDIAAQAGAARELLPAWLEAVALIVLLWLGSRPVRQWVGRRLGSAAPR